MHLQYWDKIYARNSIIALSKFTRQWISSHLQTLWMVQHYSKTFILGANSLSKPEYRLLKVTKFKTWKPRITGRLYWDGFQRAELDITISLLIYPWISGPLKPAHARPKSKQKKKIMVPVRWNHCRDKTHGRWHLSLQRMTLTNIVTKTPNHRIILSSRKNPYDTSFNFKVSQLFYLHVGQQSPFFVSWLGHVSVAHFIVVQVMFLLCKSKTFHLSEKNKVITRYKVGQVMSYVHKNMFSGGCLSARRPKRSFKYSIQ